MRNNAVTIRREKEYFRKFKGKEIFEIKPIILGGSPTDSANKIALSRKKHIQAVNYWNSVIKKLKKSK